MRLNFAVLLCILIAACANPAQNPNSSQSAALLIAQWNNANGNCRGLSPSDPRMQPACDLRDNVLSPKIEAQGFCYGENAEYGYQQRWDICNRLK